MDFLVVYGKVGEEYEGFAPDIPGCVRTGKTREEVEKKMRLAVKHAVFMARMNEDPPPVAESWSEYVSAS